MSIDTQPTDNRLTTTMNDTTDDTTDESNIKSNLSTTLKRVFAPLLAYGQMWWNVIGLLTGSIFEFIERSAGLLGYGPRDGDDDATVFGVFASAVKIHVFYAIALLVEFPILTVLESSVQMARGSMPRTLRNIIFRIGLPLGAILVAGFLAYNIYKAIDELETEIARQQAEIWANLDDIVEDDDFETVGDSDIIDGRDDVQQPSDD